MISFIKPVALAACVAALGVAGAAHASDNEGRLRAPSSGGSSSELAGSSATVFAVAVRADGSWVKPGDGIGVRSVTKQTSSGVGYYEVIFQKGNLHKACFYSATVGDRDAGVVTPGVATVDARAGTNNGLWISTYGLDGVRADRDFLVTVICRN